MGTWIDLQGRHQFRGHCSPCRGPEDGLTTSVGLASQFLRVIYIALSVEENLLHAGWNCPPGPDSGWRAAHDRTSAAFWE